MYLTLISQYRRRRRDYYALLFSVTNKGEYENFEAFEAALENTQLSLIELKEGYQQICQE
ncbi:MAG: hypothetical protein KPI85_04180 [cyanobacterium endosymbiont of Epithemia adnata isolate EadnSB Bon19]